MTSTPTRPVDNVVIATKGLQDRNTNIIAGTTGENKGKLILTKMLYVCNFFLVWLPFWNYLHHAPLPLKAWYSHIPWQFHDSQLKKNMMLMQFQAILALNEEQQNYQFKCSRNQSFIFKLTLNSSIKINPLAATASCCQLFFNNIL